jgi:hypothetical protein
MPLSMNALSEERAWRCPGREGPRGGRILAALTQLDLDQKRAVVKQLQKEISDAEASVAEEPQDRSSSRGQVGVPLALIGTGMCR